MSGTSLDGLDIVYCGISGSGMKTSVEIYKFETVSYPTEVKDEIRKIFAKATISFEQLCVLNPWIGRLHAEYILRTLQKWNVSPSDVDLIASHGQTVYHAPAIQHKRGNFPDATLQIGDGDHIAVKTGIITISDFRQKHIAGGGEGAPLALYGDYCIFMKKGENRIMLNMGGIANFTFLPSNGNASEVFVTDTGPGNTIIDAAMQKFFAKEYDKDGMVAGKGRVSEPLLKELLANEFLSKEFPKTTGPEVFNLAWVEEAQASSGTENISHEDLVATITFLSAATITDALKKVMKEEEEYHVYSSGGGAHNPALMRWIKEALLAAKFHATDELGIPGDAKEAILFAILANETIAGQAIDFKRSTMPAISMGKISFPY